MKRFAAGVIVGAALGVAGTLAAARRVDDVAPAPPRDVVAPGEVLAASAAPAGGAATPVSRRAAPRATDAPSATPPASPAAPAPKLDVEKAPLEELVAAIRGPIDGSGKLPGGWSPALICGAIARRFPGFHYPPDLVIHLIAMTQHENNGPAAFDGAVATWTDDVALAEFARLLGSGAPDDRYVVHAIGRVLRARGGGLPSDTCAALLRDANADARGLGIGLSEYAKEIDVAGLAAIAARDPDAKLRASAVWMLQTLVVDLDRLRPEDVADTILGALRDPDADVSCAAERSLNAAGPKGARAAIQILARDGDVANADELAAAAVLDGRAAEVLDMRLGRRIAAHVADALAHAAAKRPELLRELAPRFIDLRTAVAESKDSGVQSRFFEASRDVFGSRVVVESALNRDLDSWTRMSAVGALLENAATWQEGHDLVRRIAADRTESGRIRLDALDELETTPEGGGGGEGLHEEARRFLAELLAGETNDRVRSWITRRLSQE